MSKDDIKRDKIFREWVQKQVCAVCGQFAEYVNGEGRNHAAHYNTAANAGKGTKALFSCIPLCFKHHALQHQKGIFALGTKEWWQAKVDTYRTRWMREEGV